MDNVNPTTGAFYKMYFTLYTAASHELDAPLFNLA